MEKKLLITLLIGFFITVIMYFILKDDNNELLAIGDSLAVGNTPYNLETYTFNDYLKDELNTSDYNSEYIISDITSRNLLDLLLSNTKLKDSNLRIKQSIKSANIITIAIGNDEINENSNINLYLYYMNAILNEITKINSNIYVIGLISDNSKVKDINNSLSDICKKYDINFISTESLKIDTHFYPETNILNTKGHEEIKNNILKLYTANS